MTHPAARSYFRSYAVRRHRERDFVVDAVHRAGGHVLHDTGGGVAPMYVAIEEPDTALTGVLIYLFSANHRLIRNRPPDEHRLQIKYGDITEAFRNEDHSIGFDPMTVEVTLVLAVHSQAGLLIGLDPLAYDPLPMGIQVGFKASHVEAAKRSGWRVWERPNRPGRRRDDPRVVEGFETMVAFAPERLLDYIAFERHAQTMKLDPALRLRAAEGAATTRASVRVHDLEQAYSLSALDILSIVRQRPRLAMALRGGVAEYHLGRRLSEDPRVRDAQIGTQEGPPDYWVKMRDRTSVTVECKNASPKLYANGDAKVEVQKTRASRGDALSRLYRVDAFDVLAACMYGPTGQWSFRFKRSENLERHPDHPDRIAPMQRINESWQETLAQAIEA